METGTNADKLRPEALLMRKDALGKLATYEKLRDRTGISHTTIHRVLTASRRVPAFVNQGRVLSEVAAALDEIEREAERPQAA